MAYHTFGGSTYSLGASIGSTDTSILLTSFTEPVSGVLYTFALLNTDIVYATIAPGTSSAEFISFTSLVQNIDGSCTLGGVVRGLAKKSPFTTSATFKLPHSSQTTFIISNPPQLYEKFASKDNAETLAGVKTFSSFPITPSSAPTTDYQIANKKYVDDVALVGAPNMSLTVKGIGEEATQAEIDAGTQAGATLAELVVNPKYLKDSIYYTQLPTSDQKAALAGTGTPNSTNKYVTNDDTSATSANNKVYRMTAAGKLDATLLVGNLPAISGASLTGIIIFKNGILQSDTSGAQTVTHNLGYIPKRIRLTNWGNPLGGSSAGNYSSSVGSYDSGGQNCIYVGGGNGTGAAPTALSNYSVYVENLVSADKSFKGAIGTVTSTQFTITWTDILAGGNVVDNQILWEVEV